MRMCAVLGFESRTLYMLGKHISTLHPQPGKDLLKATFNEVCCCVYLK